MIEEVVIGEVSHRVSSHAAFISRIPLARTRVVRFLYFGIRPLT